MNINLINDLRDLMADDKIELEDDPDEEIIIDLKFIVDECPDTKIVRQFMAHQIQFIQEDDEFFIS